MARPKGLRGSWFAKWQGEELPCVHEYWARPAWPHHVDPGVDDNPKWGPFIEAIQRGKRVILTRDKLGPDGLPIWEREGYIALYRVENVEVRGAELHFDLVERLADFT